jgi:hypothetical protein
MTRFTFTFFNASVFFLFLNISITTAQPVTIYVSNSGDNDQDGMSSATALETFQAAWQKAKGIRQNDPDAAIMVIIEPGEYFWPEPVLIRAQDFDNRNGSLVVSGDSTDRAVISGGKKITGWKKWKGQIWRAYVPEVKKNGWDFRQAWVDGQKAIRARTPNSGFYRVTGFPDGGPDAPYDTPGKHFEFQPGQFSPAWKNLKDVEVVVYHFWTDSHLRVDTVDNVKNIVSFQNESGKRFTDDYSNQGARYIIDNVFEALDSAGEWYLDRKSGYIYYYLRMGEDPYHLDFYAPVTEKFLVLQGDPSKGQYVANITFMNLEFKYTNFRLSDNSSNNNQASSGVSASINFSGTRNCKFENCSINNIGNYAIDVTGGSVRDQFTRNSITHTGAGGIRINGGTNDDSPLQRTRYIDISDNEIGWYGEEYPSAVGVLLMNASDNKIVHNLIHNGWYTGVSVGWSWGYQPSVSIDNLIAYNHIHTIGQGLLSDMGGIYTLGVSPGTILRNNLIHDVDAHGYGGWGIYNDEGSTHILVENNIVYNTKFAGYDIHYAKEIMVRNNIFALGTLQQLNRTRMENHISVFFENNIIYWKEGELYSDNWNDKTYNYYVNPNTPTNVVTMNSTFVADWNVYYNPGLTVDKIKFSGGSWEEWHARGKDTHSLYTDPMFTDPEHFNFTLKPGSPAFSLGFIPIDMSTVGPRK